MIYVIGSGPAGVSCATALLEQGLAVTMLDIGNELDARTIRSIEALRAIDPQQWQGEATEFMRNNIAPDRKGVGRKFAYGSDFPYRGSERLATITHRDADPLPSLAKGGFSNVWGGAMLPFVASDIDEWPVSIDDLAPHYRGVLQHMNLAAQRDDLADKFPLYTEQYHSLENSRQAKAFLDDLKANRPELQAAGVTFGSSRLAVRANSSENGPGCVYCGLCMYGCPNELIYNSAAALPKLMRDSNFQYVSNVVVKRLEEHADGVRIVGKSADSGSPIEFNAERVYLACGTVSTTQILLESLGAFDRPVRLIDSCYYLFPLARLRGVSKVASEPLQTLSQVFIEIADPEMARRPVHLQVYTYNDMLPAAIKKSLGPLFPLAKLGLNSFLSRMLIVQGYLHSDLSPAMTVTLRRTNGGDERELILEKNPKSPAGIDTIKRVMKKLRQQWRLTRAVPLTPLMHLPSPGRGFHSGGSFPMRVRPGEFESDSLGRPSGLRRVHAVDATVLPSIPATTITFSIMANARRIASLHGTI